MLARLARLEVASSSVVFPTAMRVPSSKEREKASLVQNVREMQVVTKVSPKKTELPSLFNQVFGFGPLGERPGPCSGRDVFAELFAHV